MNVNGQGYRKLAKNESSSRYSRKYHLKVKEVWRRYSKPSTNGRPRKINEPISRWINRNVQINPHITRSEIKTDLEGAGINISKDTVSRALYRTGFHSRSSRKVPLLKTKHVKDRLKFVETYENKGMKFSEKVNKS